MNTPLQEWINSQCISDDMLWKGAFGRQVGYVRDVLVPLVGTGLEWDATGEIARVISTHRSKSIVLPVYELSRPDLGLRLILRNNFHDWKLSVISERPITADFSGLFYTTSPIEPSYTGNPLVDCYFEGFPSDLVFGFFSESDGRKWSAEIFSNESLYTTIFLLLRSLNVIKPYVWHTEKSHRKELDEATERRRQREARKNG